LRYFPVLLSLLLLSACENVDRDLWSQITYKPQEAPRMFNPQNSVPRFGARKDFSEVEGATLEPPVPLAGLAGKGKGLYDIYCEVCHGAKGRADTPVAAKMDVEPFDLTGESTAALTDGEIFIKILASDTVMPNYRNELTDDEAWAITAYVRKLSGG